MAVEGNVWETFLKRVFILFGTTEMTHKYDKIHVYFSQERENIKGNYEDDVDQMNQQLSDKASKQMLLTEKRNEIQSLKDKIVQVKTAQQDLKENMIQKSKTFAESKQAVETEVLWPGGFSQTGYIFTQ